MRKEVIDFLSDLPEAPVDQFNGAIRLYMRTPGANVGLTKFYNAAGYNQERLTNLLHDLKQANGISDADLQPVASSATAKATNQKAKRILVMPKFSKGVKGNHERRDYLEKHELKAKSNSNDDLDLAIGDHIRSTFLTETMGVLIGDLVENGVDSKSVNDVLAMFEELDLDTAEAETILEEARTSAEDQLVDENIVAERKENAIKLMKEELAKADSFNEEFKAALQKDLDMDDDEFEAFFNEQKAAIIPAVNPTLTPEEIGQQDPNAKTVQVSGLDVPNNDTDIPKNGTDVQKNETSESNDNESSTEKK